MTRRLVCCLLPAVAVAWLLSPSAPATAAVLATYNFTTTAPVISSTGLSAGTFIRGPGANAQASAGKFASTGFNAANLSAAITGRDYVGFTVSPEAGYGVSIYSVQYDYTHASGGTPQGQLLSSHTGFSASAPLGSVKIATGRTTSLSNFNDLTTSTEFRFYMHGSNSASRHRTFDNVIVRGQTQALANMNAVVTQAAPSRVFRGTEDVAYTVSLTNDALAAGTIATQALNYSLGISGDGVSISDQATAPLAGGASASEVLAVDTSTAGAKGGSATLSSSNAWRAGGVAGANAMTLDLAEVDVFDRSNASFVDGALAGTDTDALLIDFGTVQPGGAWQQDFSLQNLVSTLDFTAGLDLDAIVATGDTDVFATDLQSFSNLAAGSQQAFQALFAASTVGDYSATYTLFLGDEDGIAGDEQLQTLTLTVQGSVAEIDAPRADNAAAPAPEPSTLLLLAGSISFWANRRLRRRRV